MSGKGGRGRGGRSGSSRGSGGRGRGYTGHSKPQVKGLCKELGTHVFDYGTKGVADQMRTTWEKLCQYVGSEMGEDIASELRNERQMTVPIPTHSQDIVNRNQQRQAIIIQGQTNMQTARHAKLAALQNTANPDPMEIASLTNEIAMAELEMNQPVAMELTSDKKTAYDSEWRTYRNKKDQLEKNRGQAYSLILGQCTQLLQDRMQQDGDWNTVKTSSDPLQLYALIKKTVQGQTEDQYVYATVYEQMVGLFGYRQETMSNAQWYEQFNTRVYVATSVGVSFDHKILLEHEAKKSHPGIAYTALTDQEKEAV